MNPEVQYYLAFSEPQEGIPRRILIEFVNAKYCVLLLNEKSLFLRKHILDTTAAQFSLIDDHGNPTLELPIGQLSDADVNIADQDAVLTKAKSWFVYYSDNKLITHTKTSAHKKMLPPEVGYIITGKENLLESVKIKRIRSLEKTEKTPFITDSWGDSWNDSFVLEPRVIEDIPSTVFDAVNSIMTIARQCYSRGSQTGIEAAAEKYRKAFHYCHKYYPDDLNQADLAIATELKIKSLLNLALCGIKSGKREWLIRAVESCDLVLGMPELQELHKDHAKALYRRGKAKLLLGDEEVAQKDFELSLRLLDDEATHQALRDCDVARAQRQRKLRAKMKSAF